MRAQALPIPSVGLVFDLNGMNGVAPISSTSSTLAFVRYALSAEFDFRHTTRKVSDPERAQTIIDRVAGRRLAYKRPRFV